MRSVDHCASTRTGKVSLVCFRACGCPSLARCVELLDVTSMDVPQADSVAQSLRSMGHMLFSSLKSKRLEVGAVCMNFDC